MEEILLNRRYRLVSVVGKGGMATVYRAQDTELNRVVALKVLHPDAKRAGDAAFLDRFRAEAQSVAGLAHPNVVAVYDIGHDGERDWHYIVMEYVEGADLRRWLSGGEPLPPVRALDVAIQVTAALAYAHRAGRVHGDLKPGNILITPDGRVKVTDFGIAQALSSAPPSPPAPVDGSAREVVWGTPAYFAPEQAAGEPLAPPVDLYALGVIMYEMLGGRPPFVAATPFDLALMHLEEPPPPLEQLNPRLPPGLAQIVHKLLAKAPADRYASAEQLSQALIQYRREMEGATGLYPPTLAAPATLPGRKANLDWLAVLLGLVTLALVLGLVSLWSAVARSRLDGGAYLPPTPLPTPAPGEVPAPDLVGLDRDLARQALRQAGLDMAVAGQEPDPTIPALTVLRQSVPPGYPLPPGAVVEIVISSGPDLVVVPPVVGLSLSDAGRTLSAARLFSETEETWSEQGVGRVISQEPPADSVVPADSRVVLLVSSGSRLPVGALLGSDILLVACDLPRTVSRPGETLRITLHWQALAPVAADYTVFVHLTGAEGQVVAQQDSRPVAGAQPTNNWQVGVPVADTYDLRIPLETPPGDYWIRAGMYSGDTGQRLPVTDSGRVTQEGDGLLLYQIRIK
jgi:predicted Ser/Thr protein kinase